MIFGASVLIIQVRKWCVESESYILDCERNRLYSAKTMESSCSLSGLQSILCGESRGASEIVGLLDCNDEIRAHLSRVHLSRSDLKEH